MQGCDYVTLLGIVIVIVTQLYYTYRIGAREWEGMLATRDEENQQGLTRQDLADVIHFRYMRRLWTLSGAGLAIVSHFIGHQPKDGKQEL